jgi:hypothetical protein
MNRVFAAVLLSLFISCPWQCRAQDADVQRLLDAAKSGTGPGSLLEKGTSPKVRDAQGRTPLHLAAANGHQAAAGELLRFGADVNALDNFGKTPLDLATAAGHTATAKFLEEKGGIRTQAHGDPGTTSAQRTEPSAATPASASATRGLKPSLKFRTAAEFEREIREPAVLLDSQNVCFFAPARRETEARTVLGYLVKAYDALYRIVGVHTDYRIAVYAFPGGNPNGWGGTSECSIEYDDGNLNFARQPEWVKHGVPHVSGYIEEIAHNFVHATKAQFGWEMIGWSLGAQVSQEVAGNPILAADIHSAREGQERTFVQYVLNGHVFPADLPPNQCDRIHAWLLHKCATKYGARFWNDFFREVRSRKQDLVDAARLGDGDKVRNTRYQITIDCFGRLPGTGFRKLLQDNRISLTTDVKSLHPEAPGWNRRLSE